MSLFETYYTLASGPGVRETTDSLVALASADIEQDVRLAACLRLYRSLKTALIPVPGDGPTAARDRGEVARRGAYGPGNWVWAPQ
jgi:hypothetical protein